MRTIPPLEAAPWSNAWPFICVLAVLLLVLGAHFDRLAWLDLAALALGFPASILLLAPGWATDKVRSDRSLALHIATFGAGLTAWAVVAWWRQPACCPTHRLPGNLGYTWVAIFMGWAAIGSWIRLSDPWRRRFLVSLVAITGAASLVAVLQTTWAWPDLVGPVADGERDFSIASNPMLLTGVDAALYRAYGFDSYCIAFGNLSATMLILSLWWTQADQQRRHGALVVAIVLLSALGVVLSMSRTAMACSLAMAGACAVRRQRYSRISMVIALALTAGLFLLRPATVDGNGMPLMDRFVHDGRWQIWRATIAVVEDSPWIGAGRGDAFAAQAGNAMRARGHALPETPYEGHNDLLTTAAFYGLPAALLLAVLLASLAWILRRPSPSGEPSFLIPMICLAGLGLTSSPLHQRGSALLIFAAFGMLAGHHRMARWTREKSMPPNASAAGDSRT